MEFVHRNNLHEYFCNQFLADAPLVAKMYPKPAECDENVIIATITVDMIHVAAQEGGPLAKKILEIAKAVVNERALRGFKYQERWLLETLGCHMAILGSQDKKLESSKESIETKSSRSQNAHTTCGRHTNDWLFGGVSVGEKVNAVVERITKL